MKQYIAKRERFRKSVGHFLLERWTVSLDDKIEEERKFGFCFLLAGYNYIRYNAGGGQDTLK